MGEFVSRDSFGIPTGRKKAHFRGFPDSPKNGRFMDDVKLAGVDLLR
jgi:hypothetical protein